MVHRRREDLRPTLLVAAALSLVLHIPLAIWFLDATYFSPTPLMPSSPMQVRLLDVTPPEPEEPNEQEEEPEADGQIVEIAPPEDQRRPDEADFLAEFDSTVPEQLVDPRYRVDRTITAPTYSPDDLYERENESSDSAPEQPSAGSMAGRETFAPGRFSLFPDRQSPWDRPSPEEGLDTPVPSPHTATRMAGSPSNDYLPDIASADRTALNSHEFLYASFWNRVKQLVSFFADQTLANARPTVAIRKPQYDMVLSGLIAVDGSLQAIDIERSSGVPEWDRAIQEAFHMAAPFPDPPEGAADPATGFIPIRNFGFSIMIGGARAEMSGIDPRQSVQFPGLETLPR